MRQGKPVKGQKQKGSGSKKAVRAWWRGESLSAVFTQTRLFRPECVSAGILMLTYLSTLRSKSRRFLFRPKNAYFANSSNTSHRLRFAAASLRKATSQPAFDDERRKAEEERQTHKKRERSKKQEASVWCGGEAEKYKEVLLFAPGESLSAVFTQTRLFRPECVSAGILMLTYLSTLRSKSRRFLFRPKNAYFANSPNTSHRLRFAAASLRKATPRPAFDDERRKAEAQERREKQTAGKSLVRAAKAEDRDG